MARVCDVCGKRPMSGNHVSHAHNLTKRKFNPNLQTIRAESFGRKKKIKVCTSCIRDGRITKPAIAKK